MKYIAIIDTDNELSEDAIKNLTNDTVFIGDEAASYCFTMTSIQQASDVACICKYCENYITCGTETEVEE